MLYCLYMKDTHKIYNFKKHFNTSLLWHFRFSQRCYKRYKYSGMLHCLQRFTACPSLGSKLFNHPKIWKHYDPSKQEPCTISGSCCDVHEIRHLLGYYAAKIGSLLPMYQDNPSIPSSSAKQFKKNATQFMCSYTKNSYKVVASCFCSHSTSQHSTGNPLPSSPSLSELPMIH
jgi:hypothetical protein